MASDIVGAIEIIDGRIARLRELRNQLAEAIWHRTENAG